MPVTVHVPIRVRVDVDALTSRLNEISDAVAAAAGRALASSRAIAVEPRGGYLGLRAHEPTFAWSGNGLDRVSASARRILEMQIRALVLAEAERRLVGDGRDRVAPEPIPADPSEAVDRSRYWDPVHYYALPSYDQGGNKILMPVRVATFTEEELEAPETIGWVIDPDPDDLMPMFFEALTVRGRTPPTSGLLGFMFASPPGFMIEVVKFHGQDWLGVWSGMVTIRLPKWDQDKKKFVYVGTPIRPVGSFMLKAIGGGSNTAQAKQIFERYLRDNVLPLLIKTAPVDLEPDDIDKMFTQLATAEFEKMVSAQPGPVHFGQLGLPSGDQVLLVGKTAPAGPVEIIPLSVMRPVRRSGKSAGTGDGARKKVLDPSILQRAQGQESEAQLLLLNATAEGEGSIYPQSASSRELSWDPFEGEPSVDELGADGKLLRELMERIAQRLALSGWTPYAGRFLMNAATAIGGRGSAVQSEAIGELTQITDTIGVLAAVAKGNLGKAHFVPKPSKAMAFYKYILAVAPWINLLYDAVKRVFDSGAHERQLENLTAGRQHWLHHVYTEFRPSLIESCAWIFVYSCQAMMLQLLGASKSSIERRWENREGYAGFFYRAVIMQLSAEAELLRLQEALQGAIERTPKGEQVSARQVVFGDKWARYETQRNAPFATPPLSHAAARDLDRQLLKLGQLPRPTSPEGTIQFKDGQPAIVDDYGNPWTLDDLKLTIEVRHSTAMALDPILNHYLHEHALTDVHRYTPKQASEALFELLRTMLSKNEETTNDMLSKTSRAFEKGKIVEISDVSDPQYLPRNAVGGYDLQGIHLIVWQELQPALGSDRTLEAAVDVLFSHELGFNSLKSFSEFVGITLLAVVCPPLAAGVMAAQAIHGYSEAKKGDAFYQSFIDPEQLVSWADVQAELFVAKVMLIITLVPTGGSIVRGFLPRARTLLSRGLKGELRAAIRQEMRALYRAMAEELKKDLMAAFVKDLGKNYLIMTALEKVMSPLIAEVQRNASLPAYRQ